MLPVVEQVAARLENDEELAVEIIVPSLLAPFPRKSLVEAVGSSPRVVVVEESHDSFGVSAEVLASLLEAGYPGRAARIGTPPVPILSARSLESQILPTEDRIIEKILQLF
jgi:2-oxoisovalerate dehydrogenase E1 component